MTAKMIPVLLGTVLMPGCVARPVIISKTPPPEVQERLRALTKTLPANSMLRNLLQVSRYGDGVHQRWMDDMQQRGVKMARVEVHFTWFFGPRLMKATRVMYFTGYETTGHQITDPSGLEKLRGSRLESDLKEEGIWLAPGAHWLDLPESIFRPFPGQTTVTLFDDEWLPLPFHMYTRIDPYRPPLIQAIFSGDEADVRSLLASRTIGDEEKDEGLNWACGLDEQEVLEMLLKAGANVNARNGKDLVTPLIVAARRRNVKSIEMLLAAGADANLSDAESDTPPLAALNSSKDSTGVVQLLLNANADVNAANIDGLTPLMRAGQTQKGPVLEILIKRGANINAADRRGNTALIWAAQFGNRAAVPALLAAHADTDIRNQSGQTALSVATVESHSGIVEMLKEAGAMR